MLYITPVPIGNARDITLRALDVLRAADFVFCEDTRQTRKLLDLLGINVRAVRYNEKDSSSLEYCLSLLKDGKNCALVSDAGTPCISDPGWKLVKAAREANVKITALPGACALGCALSAAGLGGGGFVFLGFPSKKSGKTLKALAAAFELNKPVVLYESPYRVVKLLELVKKSFVAGVKVFIARELTKTFEEFLFGTTDEVLANLKARKKILGEFTVILDNREGNGETADEDEII
jgi:16S rRNA (cytidine1402-2'-O)-methyltransferase